MPQTDDIAVDPRLTAGAGAAPRRPAATETLRLYRADWAAFQTWCTAGGLPALPAGAATVADFLSDGAARLSAGALARRAAAIADRHRQRGLASPCADPAVAAVLRAARRRATPRRPPFLRPAQLVRMAAACPGDLAGRRDRALLLLAAAGFSRAALVGLDVEGVRFTPTAVEFSVVDRKGGLDTVAVARGATTRTCPVQALHDWLRVSDTRFGPVFRKVDRWGNVEQRALGTDAVRRIVARRMRSAKRGNTHDTPTPGRQRAPRDPTAVA
jgi:integrase